MLTTLISTMAAVAAPEQLTIERVLELGLTVHPQVNAARARAESRRSEASSLRGRLFPVIQLSDEYQHYDSPFDIEFAGGSFEARKQDVNTFAAGATQPLLGLLARVEHFRAALATADATETELEIAKAALKEGLSIAYLRLFEANALKAIAEESRKELEAQRGTVESKVKAGVLTNADLLRVEVGAREAEQQAIEAATRAESQRAEILGAIGMSPASETIELSEPTPLMEQSKKPPPTFAEALEQMRRPELVAAASEVEAAHHLRLASWFDLLPDIDAEAIYLHSDGQTFLPDNQAYVGVNARWRFFEGGASYYQQRAALHRMEAAEEDSKDVRRQAEVELAQRIATVRSSQSAITVADKAIESAAEAYRVMKVQVEGGAATTTDLLDAESALSQARLRRARAEYDAAIAWVQLSRAMGK